MMGPRLEKINFPYQIERIIRDWIPRNKPILSITIDSTGSAIHIEYQQNKKEIGFIAMQVGMK